MIRLIIVAIAAFVTQLFVGALCVPFGLAGTTLLIAPAALVLVTTEFTGYEALASLLLLGFLLDAWIGAPVGIIMLVLAFMWLLAICAIIWLGKPDVWIRILLIFCFSLAFRVCVALALGIAGGSQGNFEWGQIFGMPLIDVGFGLVFYRVMMRLLNLLGLCEIRENTSQRLSRRSPRIRLE